MKDTMQGPRHDLMVVLSGLRPQSFMPDTITYFA